MTQDDLDILTLFVDCRSVILEGETLLQGVRDGGSPAFARRVFDGVLPLLNAARRFAQADFYASCRESLLQLADDLEALRVEAKRLL